MRVQSDAPARGGVTVPLRGDVTQVRVAARARGDAGHWRLHRRWVRFNERGKRPVVANVAVARELAGWCWSLAVMD